MTGRDDCTRVEELLPEFLAGRVSDDDDRLVRQHLESCDECRNRANAVSLLQQTPIPSPDPDRWDDFVKGVVEATGEGRRKGHHRRLWWAAAAVVAAAVVVFVWTRTTESGAGGSELDALARQVAELPAREAAAWTAGLSATGFMPAGFETSGLSEQDIDELVREVGRT